MFVALDPEALRFLFAHANRDVVYALAYLEAPDSKHILFENTTRGHFLAHLTSMELNLLYRNTTGKDFGNTTSDPARREVLAQIATAMEPRDVVLGELEKQIDAVVNDLEQGIPYRYIKGAKLPARREQGLFPLTGAAATADQLTEAETVGVQRRPVHSAPTTPATPVSAPQPAQRVARATAGSIRPKIWAKADEMWAAAGKPTEKTAVLALRKDIMTELEKDGVKRTSSSNELGNWQKDRLG
jgi:hypothetical protein